MFVLAGCRGGSRKGTLDELFVSNHRFNIDEQAGVVRIYGRLDNAGAGHFAAIDVYATLRSTNGDSRGENKVELKDIKPHEQRPFALVVTSHDRVSDVDLEVRSPSSP
jgi:hypothetical protein